MSDKSMMYLVSYKSFKDRHCPLIVFENEEDAELFIKDAVGKVLDELRLRSEWLSHFNTYRYECFYITLGYDLFARLNPGHFTNYDEVNSLARQLFIIDKVKSGGSTHEK